LVGSAEMGFGSSSVTSSSKEDLARAFKEVNKVLSGAPWFFDRVICGALGHPRVGGGDVQHVLPRH
jgi:hypothetical protein